jgi:hypothetical protein
MGAGEVEGMEGVRRGVMGLLRLWKSVQKSGRRIFDAARGRGADCDTKNTAFLDVALCLVLRQYLLMLTARCM